MSEQKQQRQTTLFSFFCQTSKKKQKDETSKKKSKDTQMKKKHKEPKSTASGAALRPTTTKEREVGVVSPVESKTKVMIQESNNHSANIRKRPRPTSTTVAKEYQHQDESSSLLEQSKAKLCEPMDDHMKENVANHHQVIVSSPTVPPMPKEQGSDDEIPNDDHDDSESDADNKTETETDGMSAYELLRQRNIERNNARLASLGLLSQTEPPEPKKPRRRRKRKTPSIQPKPPSIPTRRSTRTRKPVGSGPSENATSTTLNHTLELSSDKVDETVQGEEEEEETYTVSPLLQYAMMDSEATKRSEQSPFARLAPKSTKVSIGTSSCSLRPMGPRLAPPKGLKAIYSLDFFGSFQNNNNRTWLVGAGKAGIVALWDCGGHACKTSKHQEEEVMMIDPTLTWKAHHGRWIAEARFLPSSVTTTTSSPSRLVTAANDGKVCLWDLSAVSVRSGAPKLLSQSGGDLHTSGIFAMDVSSNNNTASNNNNSEILIATGSKDKTVAVSILSETSLSSVRPIWKSNIHTAKVGAVRLHPTQRSILASASDDNLVCIHDHKCGEKKNGLEIDDAHNRPHSVVWDPYHANLLMTAGLDKEIKIWDIRSTKEPVVLLHGHVPENTPRCKRIHHPAFYYPQEESAFVLSGGERSQALSMFHHDTTPSVQQQQQKGDIANRLCSRGKLPVDCGDAGCISVNDDKVAVSVHEGEILILSPSLEKQ